MQTVLDRQLQAALDKRPAVKNLQTPSNTSVDLFSNDYLALSRDVNLRADLFDRLSSQPDILGSCGSRILDGNTPKHVSLEARLRDYYNAEAALIFQFGIRCQSLPVHDGMRVSRASKSLHSFQHNSAAHLKTVLQDLVNTSPAVRSGSCNVFVAVESVYSMDGDIAPLMDLVEVVEQIIPSGCARIIVDEAHSTGLYGLSGRGIVSHLGLEKRVSIVLHSFTKAMASTGAVVLSSSVIRSFLINFARPFIYTTSMSRVSVITIEASLDVVQGEIGDQRRERLLTLVKYTTNVLKREFSSIPSSVLRLAPLPFTGLLSPIIPILTPHAPWLCWQLRKRGWAAVPILPPTVPKGEERIRMSIHAGNTEEEIEGFARAIVECIREESQKRELASGLVFDD